MKKIEPNPRNILIFSDEDADQIKRLAALHLDLQAIATHLKIDVSLFTEEYHREGSVLRHLIDGAENNAEIEMRLQTAERLKDTADHEAVRLNRADAKQARWDRYKSKLLFDKKVDESEVLRMAIECGDGKLPEKQRDHFEKLDFIRSLYTQMNSRNYIISAVRIKWPNVTWSVARNLFYESINFFNSDNQVKRETWANVYADQLDVISSMAFEQGQLDIAGKYKVEAARLRGIYKEVQEPIPDELLNRRPVIYSLRPEDFGMKSIDRRELARFIDDFDVPVVEKRKLKRDAQVDKLEIDVFLDDCVDNSENEKTIDQ